MKRLSFITLILASVFSACGPIEPTPVNPVVVIPEGAVTLMDTEFGMYYGDINNDGTGVFSVVLSDALCYQDKLGSPYLDSEGDLVVLQFKTDLLESNQAIALPVGEYAVTDEGSKNSVYAPESYVTRMTGTTQVKWAVKSGSVSVAKDDKGVYTLVANDLTIEKNGVVDTLDYVCNSTIVMSDYMEIAPALLGGEDDIINMPFTHLMCTYYGNLYGNGTGNFLVSMATKGFIVVDENGTENMTDIPGVYVTLNFFSRLYAGSAVPVLEEGRYTVSGTSSDQLLSRWSLMPGMLMDGTPFGTYILQLTASGEGIMEYVNGGYVDVEYPDEANPAYCVLKYSLKTSKRELVGVWRGEMPVNNLAESSTDSYLTTLDHDVECDMSKVTGGTLSLIETLHRKNVEATLDYDIAEAWQLYLGPRDWNQDEKDIPWVDEENPDGADGIPGTDDDWMYDKNKNGIRDRLEAWNADGDVMVLEFILPLGSQGVIAPELNKTYTYTMQPSLDVQAEMYEIYVSQMGRPADEIFDAQYASEHPGWAEQLGITSYDRCNARRGFTWSEDGFRGNWYMHYETGQHMILDEHAPAINGEVKVTRTGDNTYDFEWNFIDDCPGTPNRITGSMKDCVVGIHLN